MESTQKVDARSCSKPIFLYALAPRYGHLVEELDIRRFPISFSAINTLTSLALLPTVRKIMLPSVEQVCTRLRLANETQRNGFPVEFASPGFVESALRRVMQHAKTVVLPRDGLRETIPLVRGAGLTKLEMTLSRRDLPILLANIVDCPNLHTLHIVGRPGNGSAFSDAASLPSLSHPTLRRLEISDLSGVKGMYNFIQRFASGLEELNISWGVVAPKEAPLPEPPRFHLPRLQQFEVRGTSRETAPLVQAISPATFPTLRSCTWLLHRDWSPSATFPAEVVAAIGHVRAQQLLAPRRSSLQSTALRFRNRRE